MADLNAIREAVAEAINELEGITAYGYNPDTVHPPCALVEPDGVDFRGAMNRGHETWTLMVRLLVSAVSNTAGQLARDEFLGGATDLKDAIEKFTELRDGTAAHDVFVAAARKFDSWEYAGTAYIGFELEVEVYA